MKRPSDVTGVGISILFVATIFGGCGGSGPPAGAERGACRAGGVCGSGLVCLSDVCVRPTVADGGSDAGVSASPLVVSTATRTPRTTATGVNYWLWMPAFGDDVTGTDTLTAALKPTVMRVGGYNNDANTQDPFDDAAFDTAVAYARAIGAEPIIQVPLLADTSGKPPTAATAAGMVTYGNVTKSYGLKYFSIGNEPDLYASQGSVADPTQPAIPGFTPADYCATATAYVAAMKAVDPTIKIVGPDLSWKYQAGGGDNDWLTPILTGCGDLFDVISIHRYPFEAAQATLAAAATDAASFRQVMDSVWEILQATGQGAKPLALTEMNVAYDATFCVLDASPGTVGSALWLADGLGTANALGLWTSAVWDISDDDGYALGLIGSAPAHTPRPEYYAYALFADHFGPTLVEVTSAPAGVNAYASRNQADDTTQIILVNWNQSAAPLAFSVGGLATAPSPVTFVLPPVSIAAVEIPDHGAAAAWVYSDAQRETASGPQGLTPGMTGPPVFTDGGGQGSGGAAGKTPGASCAVDGAVVCPQLVLSSPAITTMGASGTAAVTFGSGATEWQSYTYAAPGQLAPAVTLTPDGAGIQITGGFHPPISGNWEGAGLFFGGTSCIDATMYTGVQFDFAGDLGGCALAFGASFSGDTSPADAPGQGSCPGTDSTCYGPLAPVVPGTAPTIKVPFSALMAGSPIAKLDPATLVDVEWQLSAPIGADGGACSANFTVENVAFY
ncbi:MAG TPA: hypothetical protein VLC06_07175 [Polyangia bacterium]|nr:hypothetical protein [Polyangia bacterium]